MATSNTAGAAVSVTVENFVRAESDRYFERYATGPGRELGKFMFRRDVTPVDDQTIVSQNRDTLYAGAVIDLRAGSVTITLPDPGNRFMSMQTWNEDQYTPPSWSCTQCLTTHQSLDAMQPTLMAGFQHVTPDPAGTVSAITVDKTQRGLATDNFVIQAASAPRPRQPRIEPTTRDTERLAHHCYRPGPSVLRHKAELHIDSLAK